MKQGPSSRSDQADCTEDASDRVARQPQPALTTAVLAGAGLERDVRRALDGLNVRLEFTAISGVLIARIESACPQIVILDLDISPQPDDLARFARSLRPDVRIVSAQWYWSDRDAPSFADAVVHKPPRRDEWFPVIARIELSIAS
ncbi:MAG: hypothetical protein M3P30_02105 [Chloroflexota bacterium]|nr:hypothetical protein [Chloroflexota bacterium]